MRNILIGAAMLAGTAVIVLAGSARADVPKAGSTMSFIPSIVCDTEAQIEDIAKASADSNGANLVPRVKEWMAKKDAKNESDCDFQPLAGVTIGENKDLGTTYTDMNIAVHGYAVHFGTSQAEGWMLFAEEIPAKKTDPSSFQFDNWNWTRTMQEV